MNDLKGLYKKVEENFARHKHIAHGMDHAVRVAKLAKYIAEREGFDPLEAEIAGLLHDIGRTVQNEEKDHGPAGVSLANGLLDTFTDFDQETKKRIIKAIHDHSELHTEGILTHIVQDADMLDGLGAIGIMRAYTSKAQLPAYDPKDIVPHKGARNTNIHEQIAFQLEWMHMMYTTTGQEMAQTRGAFMQEFLQAFKKEVEEDFS